MKATRALRGLRARSRASLYDQTDRAWLRSCGWVRNLADGRVELQVSGENDEVAAFLQRFAKARWGYIAAEHVTEIELASPSRVFASSSESRSRFHLAAEQALSCASPAKGGR